MRVKSFVLVLPLLISLLVFNFVLSTKIFAHVVVKPSEVGIAKYQTFTVGVPNEKDIPVVGLRLIVPDNLESVSPNVKPGWNIQTKTAAVDTKMASDSAMGDDDTGPKVTEIDWTGGSIPAGQRDEFLFSAKAPSIPTTLNWKAYQTYADGSVVSWDLSPTAKEGDNTGPFSTTQVINDLTPTPSQKSTTTSSSKAEVFSLIAIALSAFSLSLQLRNRK